MKKKFIITLCTVVPVAALTAFVYCRTHKSCPAQ